MTSLVQAKRAQTTNGSGLSITLDTPPTAGNLLIAVVQTNNTLVTPTYPFDNTAADLSVGGVIIVRISSKIAGVGESSTISFTSGANRVLGLNVMEVAPTSGVPWTSGRVDKTATKTGGSTTTSLTAGPTAALSRTDDFAVFGVMTNNGFGSIPSWTSFTMINAGTAVTSASLSAAAYSVRSDASPITETVSWTSNNSTSGALVTYTPGAGSQANTGAGFLTLL